MIANANVEQMDRKDLQAVQLSNLKKTLKWAEEKSKFYQEKFSSSEVSSKDVETLEDIQKLPFTTKEELRRDDSFSRLTMPFSSVVRVANIETLVGDYFHFYTKGDKIRDMELMTRALVASGLTQVSIVGIQGDLRDSRLLGTFLALEEIGATSVPLGAEPKDWIKLLSAIGIDTLISTPQLIMQLVIQLQAMGKNIADYPVKRILCINLDNIQNPLQNHIEDRTQTKVFNLYSPSEFFSAGMLYQCEKHLGQHVAEDAFLAEIIAFGSDKEITEDHRMGELVVTTLTNEAMPLIRYRTGQAVSKTIEKCECGRTFMRIATPFSYL